jgi:hypothetical protein
MSESNRKTSYVRTQGFKSFSPYGGMDVNMAITRSKVYEGHVFKDRKPIKKFDANLEEEHRLQ